MFRLLIILAVIPGSICSPQQYQTEANLFSEKPANLHRMFLDLILYNFMLLIVIGCKADCTNNTIIASLLICHLLIAMIDSVAASKWKEDLVSAYLRFKEKSSARLMRQRIFLILSYFRKRTSNSRIHQIRQIWRNGYKVKYCSN